MSKQVRRVCFTANNYNKETYEAMQQACIEKCKYAVIGKEVGESGTRHLQGYVILKKNQRLSAVTKWMNKAFGSNPHTEAAKGSNDQAADYCKKDGVFWEHGDYPKGKGARTDIKEFLDAVRESKDDEELAINFPAEYAKYHGAASKLRVTVKNNANRKRQREKYNDAPLRNWQKKIIEKLDAQGDRTVLWVYDQLGNLGKSWLANWLTVNKSCYLVEGGRRSDIAHAYDFEEYVVFDYTRSQEEQVNYSVIESFKNGRLFAPKYESKMKIFAPCKVVCLSNFDPDRSKLSADRWKVVQFDGPCRESHWMKMPDYAREPPKKKPRLSRQNCRV